MHPRISNYPSIGPSVGQSVDQSIGPSVDLNVRYAYAKNAFLAFRLSIVGYVNESID